LGGNDVRHLPNRCNTVKHSMGSEPDFDSGLIEEFLQSSSAAEPLRVAVLAGDMRLPRYSMAIVKALRRCGFVEVVATLSLDPGATPRYGGWLNEVVSAWRELVYRVYLRAIDARAGAADPYELIGCAQALDGIPVKLIARGAGAAGEPAALPELRRLALDVILDFTAGAPSETLGAASKHGLWRYRSGADDDWADAPQMRELIRGDPVTVMELRQYGPLPGRCIVRARTQFSMITNIAVSRSRVAPAWGSCHLAVVELQRLHRQRAGPSGAPAGQPTLPLARHRVAKVPGNRAVMRWLGRYAWRALRIRLRPDRVTPWHIGIRSSPGALPDHANSQALSEFRWIDSPRGHSWADPFLFLHQSETWIFFEDFDYALRRACLRASRIGLDGSLGEIYSAVVRPQHLSYPHVFADQGEIFMVPECADEGVVELLRATEFPVRWRREATLLRLKTVDSTVFRHAGKWWMFTSPMTVAGHAAVTLLYGASQLTGPWRLHPASPISSDARYARGAGAVLLLGDRLVRPSQDCGGRYGRALVFNQIFRLDEQQFEEAPFAGLGEVPELGLYGVHTYNRADHWEVIDGRFMRPRAEI
jgi:hypothetical protein